MFDFGLEAKEIKLYWGKIRLRGGKSYSEMRHSALQVPEQALWGYISEIFLAIGMRISLKSKQNWNQVSGKHFQVMTNAIIRDYCMR